MPIYMQIQGIQGQATETNHKQWIEALSLSSPIARKIPDGAFGNDAITKGFLVFGNIFLTRKADSSSVPLARATALGKVHTQIEIHVTTPIGNGEKNLIEYKLSDAIIASHGLDITSPGAGSQEMSEHVEINFAKIEWKYTKYKKDGSSDGVIPGWYDRQEAAGG